MASVRRCDDHLPMRDGADAIEIRDASPADYESLGEMTVRAYLGLPGMPSREEAPGYYGELGDVAGRACLEQVRIVAAYDRASGRLLGGATYIDEVYGRFFGLEDSAGIRMLAVDPALQSRGVGRALVAHCLASAREAGRQVMLLHTMAPMEVARRMYERFGFQRDPALDFEFEGMQILGYRISLD